MKRRKNLNRLIQRLDHRITHLEAKSRRLAWMRLGVVISGLIAAALINGFIDERYAWGVLLIAGAGFIAFVRVHNRVEASLQRHRIYRWIKTAHTARMDLNWDTMPDGHTVATPIDHPFARDLDLTGPRTLYRLLDTTRSQPASERLWQWLTQPVQDAAHIRKRQVIVRELIPLHGFRDRLALNSGQADDDQDQRWDSTSLITWLDTHPPGRSLKSWVVILCALAGLNLGFAIYWINTGETSIWPITFFIYFLLYFGLYGFKAKELGSLLRESQHLEGTLKPVHAALLFLEEYAFSRQSHLKQLCEPIQNPTVRPSTHLKRLARAAGAAKWQNGQLLWFLLNMLVPWDLFFTHLLNQCKTEIKDHLPDWLSVWYELEALSALAHFGVTQTPVTFPDITYTPTFEAKDLGHPLIPNEERVSNDFTFQGPGDVVIVTGSNMSGKSTFLRTLGVNLCLAYAGGPVMASTMRVGLFRLFTCIRVSDSVTDGLSYFYAEVKRLKALLSNLEGDHDLPLFFLIDEIFRGTNNRERLIGSRSFIQSLTQGNGLGLISTHDLELIHLEKELQGIRNVHFRETIENNKMAFDFQLRTGPCPTTNALKIMRLEGLPVENTESEDKPR